MKRRVHLLNLALALKQIFFCFILKIKSISCIYYYSSSSTTAIIAFFGIELFLISA